MSESDIGGDLPPLDPELAAWLATDTPGPMPDDVWARLEARIAAEPALVPGNSGVTDLGAERARRRGRRVLPVLVGAAGVALVGAVVLPSLQTSGPEPVADGAVTSQPVVAAPAAAPESQDAPALTTVPPPTPAASGPDGAAATMPVPVTPRSMLATGTTYTSESMPAQVQTLLADAGMADGAGIASAMTASPAPSPLSGTGLTASAESLADCLTRLGMPAGTIPLVLDTGLVDGREGSVIVTAGAAGAEGAPAALHVIAVGQDCTEEDVAAARHWELPVR